MSAHPASTLLRPRLSLAQAVVDVERRSDGSLVLRSPQVLDVHARCVGEWLAKWAIEAPQRTFLAERRGDEWFNLDYAAALELVRRAGQGLLDRGLNADSPLMILADNSIEHAVLALGAMHVGVPVAPISPAYALLSRDFAKLRQIAELLQPGEVFVGDAGRFAQALGVIGRRPLDFAEVTRRPATAEVDAAFDEVGPDTVAKILFTSGSTGTPKGVINTQRMLTVNQQQSRQVWPFVAEVPPVVVDWLPWNHTFGGNYNVHLVLSNGGTLYIDAGKPVPGLFETTLRNLRDVAPTMYFNVPRGFDLLLPHLEQDRALRKHFFSRCNFVFYAGASLPQPLWQRFATLAREERDGDLALVSSWGATETAPLCTAVHFPVDRSGLIGLPVPGCDVKLLPSAGKLEARVRGPNITPGYFRRPDLSAAAFDDEGFYRIGDALRFVDPSRPEAGLAFDGRVAEDFKLRSGTWVHVGGLRLQLLAAGEGVIQDAVITGHDRDDVGALVFLSPATLGRTSDLERRQLVGDALMRLAADNGSGGSSLVARARVLVDPPSIEAGEITDKGYINQRAVLQNRAAELERLYAAPAAADTVLLSECKRA